MISLNYTVVDHLGDDFENQKLNERKRRVDAQIEEYTRLYSLEALSSQEEILIIETLHDLLQVQRDYSAKIKLINAICLN